MEEKRKAYSTSEAQVETNRRYLANNTEAKEKNIYYSERSAAKRFIKNRATSAELDNLELLIKETRENKKITVFSFIYIPLCIY